MPRRTTSMQMVESRESDRVRCFLRAKIVFNNRNSTFDCTVRNISDKGAKIELASAASVPARFELEVPQKNRVYNARILWRDSDAMGVEFIVDNATAAKAASPDDKIERLERENKRLVGVVRDLTRRLESLGQAVDQGF